MPVLGYLDKRSMCNFYQLGFFCFWSSECYRDEKYISVYEMKRKNRI